MLQPVSTLVGYIHFFLWTFKLLFVALLCVVPILKGFKERETENPF